MKSNSLLTFVFLSFLVATACQANRNDETDDYPEKSNNPNEDYAHVIHDDTLSADSTNMVADFDDNNFMDMAAQSTFAEIEGGKLAQVKTQNESVKGYGKMLINDHEAAFRELKNVAIQLAYTLPTTSTAPQKQALKSLSSKKDGEFDTAYINLMIKDHEKMHKAFAIAAHSAKDNDLRSFALKNEPVLRKHLEEAERLKEQLAEK